MPVHGRSSFEDLYAGQPRWEIGRPQQAILDVADRITGSVLDSGCGSGEIALIAMTGYGTQEDRRRSSESGIDHHLVKPLDFGHLERLLAHRADNGYR